MYAFRARRRGFACGISGHEMYEWVAGDLGSSHHIMVGVFGEHHIRRGGAGSRGIYEMNCT